MGRAGAGVGAAAAAAAAGASTFRVVVSFPKRQGQQKPMPTFSDSEGHRLAKEQGLVKCLDSTVSIGLGLEGDLGLPTSKLN